MDDAPDSCSWWTSFHDALHLVDHAAPPASSTEVSQVCLECQRTDCKGLGCRSPWLPGRERQQYSLSDVGQAEPLIPKSHGNLVPVSDSLWIKTATGLNLESRTRAWESSSTSSESEYMKKRPARKRSRTVIGRRLVHVVPQFVGAMDPASRPGLIGPPDGVQAANTWTQPSSSSRTNLESGRQHTCCSDQSLSLLTTQRSTGTQTRHLKDLGKHPLRRGKGGKDQKGSERRYSAAGLSFP